MKLEYLENTGDVEHEFVIRLFHFSEEDLAVLVEALDSFLQHPARGLRIDQLEVLEETDLTLEFQVSEMDFGIKCIRHRVFECGLSRESYLLIRDKLLYFINVEGSGYYWLVESEYDLLLSEGGGW
ncbi:MAG: hypothetical protein H6581_10865 [Bacteroidia bacterium]|nr:hypothetical protein [Bacteroidia bacterium]